MVSRLACKIFKYGHPNDIVGNNVSMLMPQAIAENHDQILTNFLKQKENKYNSDERLLYGLDSNQNIFPLQLRLRKAAFSSNN